MKKMFWLMIAVAFCVTLSGTAKVYAEESGTTVTTTTTTTSLKEEVASDKTKIKEQVK